MRLRVSAASVAMVMVVAAAAAAQTPGTAPSLAEVARQAEAAKATVRKSKKTYTNADLSAVPALPPATGPAAAAGGFVSKTLDQPASAEEIITRSQEKVEQDSLSKESEPRWRKRAESLRTQIAKVEARLAAFNRPNPALDDNPAAQARRATEVANFQQAREALKTDWAKLEEAARAAKIPADWLEPRPALPQ